MKRTRNTIAIHLQRVKGFAPEEKTLSKIRALQGEIDVITSYSIHYTKLYDTRHLKVLMEENWLKRGEDGLYRPGPAYLCSVTNMTGKPNPEGLIRPVVERLALETGHSAAFAEWDRGGYDFP